jgi:hypothetical protein
LEKPEKLPLGGYFQKIKDQRSEKKKGGSAAANPPFCSLVKILGF